MAPDPRVVTILALLVAPALALPAEGQGWTFVVRSVERDGDDLLVVLQNARRDVDDVRVSLLSGDALASFPEQFFRSWPAGRSQQLRFPLREDVATATLRVDWMGGQQSGSDRIGIPVPERPDAPRVVALDAWLDDADRATFVVANAGTRASGNVTLSVEDLQGVRIGRPLERDVGDLAPGADSTATFDLVRVVEDVQLVLAYGDERDVVRLRLRDADAADGSGAVVLGTDLPRREGEPGQEIDFPLLVENDGEDRFVTLRAVGLPEGYEARFFVGANGVPGLRLDAGEERNVRLAVGIPTQAGRSDVSERPFRVVASVDGEDVGEIQLALGVRGRARLELRGENWFVSLAPGGEAEATVVVANPGSAAVHDVRLTAAAPPGWQVRLEPASLARLDAGAEAEVRVTVAAPEAAGTGRYVLDLRAASDAVAASPRTLSAEVVLPASSGLGWVAAAAVAGLAAIVVIVKARRR